MNKTELIAKIAEKSGLKKADAAKALEATTETIVEALKANEKVQLVGFGTFEAKTRAARTGRNPANGETIEIAASKAPSFKAGAAFKSSLN